MIMTIYPSDELRGKIFVNQPTLQRHKFWEGQANHAWRLTTGPIPKVYPKEFR